MHQSDQELQTTIIEEMRYDPRIEAESIKVSVGNGAVILSGEVANLSEKLAVNRSAMRVRGVKAVADEMTFRDPGTTDAEIAHGARDMLNWAADVPKDAVNAEVRNHVITLSGSVAWHYQRDAAARAVTNMRGVTAVTNQIVLDQPESTTPVHRAIAAALQRNAVLDPKTIRADADGHQLLLRGTVRSFAEYRQAEQTAWAAAGVTSVRNELIVTS
jgi:osmotically-inducible protein OsmY